MQINTNTLMDYCAALSFNPFSLPCHPYRNVILKKIGFFDFKRFFFFCEKLWYHLIRFRKRVRKLDCADFFFFISLKMNRGGFFFSFPSCQEFSSRITLRKCLALNRIWSFQWYRERGKFAWLVLKFTFSIDSGFASKKTMCIAE